MDEIKDKAKEVLTQLPSSVVESILKNDLPPTDDEEIQAIKTKLVKLVSHENTLIAAEAKQYLDGFQSQIIFGDMAKPYIMLIINQVIKPFLQRYELD